MGIPGVFVSFLYELAALPGFKSSGLLEYTNNIYQKKKIDLRHEIGLYRGLGKQTMPVLFNEFFVRTSYFLMHLLSGISEHNGVDGIEWKRIVPFDNRVVDRMMIVASLTLSTVDVADAVARAAEVKKAEKKKAEEEKKSEAEKDKTEKKLLEDKKAAAEEHTPTVVKVLSTDSAIKIIYYMMAADGEISKDEEDKFVEICVALDPKFSEHKDELIRECKKVLDKALEPEDYYDTLRDGIEEAILSSNPRDNAFITPKLLLWDLLTIAYSDNKYHDDERKLMRFIVRKPDVNKSVFLEMESSIETLIDLEDELTWIKTTDRPYLTIEAMVNEIADRKNVIFSSVKDFIAL